MAILADVLNICDHAYLRAVNPLRRLSSLCDKRESACEGVSTNRQTRPRSDMQQKERWMVAWFGGEGDKGLAPVTPCDPEARAQTLSIKP